MYPDSKVRSADETKRAKIGIEHSAGYCLNSKAIIWIASDWLYKPALLLMATYELNVAKRMTCGSGR